MQRNTTHQLKEINCWHATTWMTLKKHAEQTEQDAKGYILYNSAYVEIFFFFFFFLFFGLFLFFV